VVEETKIELPYIYYLGYEVILNSNGQKINLEVYETENGFLGVTIPTLEYGSLTVKYEGTIIMKVTAVLSILTLGILIWKIYKKEKDGF